jgi:hypothetical protein
MIRNTTICGAAAPSCLRLREMTDTQSATRWPGGRSSGSTASGPPRAPRQEPRVVARPEQKNEQKAYAGARQGRPGRQAEAGARPSARFSA